MECHSISIEQVETVLRQQLGGRIRELRVFLDSNGVVLQGFATSWYCKQLAQHLAFQMIGQPIAANGIEVRPPPQNAGEPP
jgi:hypothetical protein